ncbi:hypothetical protein CKO25_18075 [Thiocapsa imhoffii]|uniref:Uncharacterized protein n=1 Tax=Thiocapsa imhoffii TaxID=382777 RepID=A0A9X0WKQ0_9GAMM|nr:hypothetical protein [Thiocapsa imhoffii]
MATRSILVNLDVLKSMHQIVGPLESASGAQPQVVPKRLRMAEFGCMIAVRHLYYDPERDSAVSIKLTLV